MTVLPAPGYLPDIGRLSGPCPQVRVEELSHDQPRHDPPEVFLMAAPQSNGSPGFVRKALSLVRSPVEEAWAREQQARYEQAQYEAATQVLQEVARRVQPEDDEGWTLLGQGSDSRALDEATATELRKAALKAAYKSPHLIGYLRSLKRHVMGRGPTFSPEVDDRLAGRMDAWWKSFRRFNRWDDLEDEIPSRDWRDGEVFVRRFVIQTTGPMPFDLGPDERDWMRRAGVTELDLRGALPEVPAGMTFLRLVPPEQITDPKGRISHGILTAAGDVQTVLGYSWSSDGKAVEWIPPDEMIHDKLRVDSDVKRGRSILEPLLKRERQFEDWLDYRIALNLARTAVVLVKRIKGGTPSQVRAIRDAQQKQRQTTTNDRKVRTLKPMTTVHASGGIEYEFLSPKLQATDARHDGRSILLSMAAPTGLPEFMFSGDSSNANYASTLVSESPAVREFEDWQDHYTALFGRIYRWVMEAAAEEGQIEGLSPDAARELEVSVEWPPIQARDELEHTKANEIRSRGGVLSREGWALDDGIDWDVERERLEAERRDEVEFTAPPQPPEPATDEE